MSPVYCILYGTLLNVECDSESLTTVYSITEPSAADRAYRRTGGVCEVACKLFVKVFSVHEQWVSQWQYTVLSVLLPATYSLCLVTYILYVYACSWFGQGPWTPK